MIRFIIVLTAVWTAPAVLPDFLPLSSSAYAAEKEKKKTRRVPALRESTYKKISEANVMIDPESVPEKKRRRLSPQVPQQMRLKCLWTTRTVEVSTHTKSANMEHLAFAYYTIGDMKGTMVAYENVLLQGVISEALEQQALRALYSCILVRRTTISLVYIARYRCQRRTRPSSNLYESIGLSLLEDIRESLKYALQVEEIALAGKEMKEPWYYLQVVDYNMLEDYDNVIRVLETLIHKYPKKQYWMHLAGMYSEKEWDDKALSAYFASYHQGFLIRETEIVMLSQRLLGADNPYEASMVLEKLKMEPSLEMRRI